MAMKIPFVGLATAVLAVGAPVGSVVAQTQQQLDAQTQQQLDWCESKGMIKAKDMEGAPDDVLADLIISGCTAVIESGKFTGNDLASIRMGSQARPIKDETAEAGWAGGLAHCERIIPP